MPISVNTLDTLPASTDIPSKEVAMEGNSPHWRVPQETHHNPRYHMRSKLRWRFPQPGSLVGRTCYIPLGQSLLWGKTHWLLVNQSEGTTTGVLRQGDLNAKGQKSGCKQGRQKEICPHLGLQNHCMWWPHPQALRK